MTPQPTAATATTSPEPGERVESRDGILIGTVAGARPAGANNAMSYVLVTRSRFFGLVRDTYLVPQAWARRRTEGARSVTLSANLAEVIASPRLRPDRQIHTDVTDVLTPSSDSPLAARIRVFVEDGIVSLSGVTRTPRDSDAAVTKSWSVAGVLGVVSHLHDDESLTYAVAQALTQDPETRGSHLMVRSRTGAIDLTGQVPSAAARDMAGTLAAAVPGVESLFNATAVRSPLTH